MLGAALGIMAAGGLASTMMGAAASRKTAAATSAAYGDYNTARKQYSSDMERLTNEQSATQGKLGQQYGSTLTDTLRDGPDMGATLHSGLSSRIAAMQQAGSPAFQGGPSTPQGAQMGAQTMGGGPGGAGPQGRFAQGVQGYYQQRAANAMAPGAFQSALSSANQQEQLYRMGQDRRLSDVTQQMGQQQQLGNLQQSFAAEPYALAQARFNAAMGQAANAGNQQAMYGSLAGLGGQVGGTAALAAGLPGA